MNPLLIRRRGMMTARGGGDPYVAWLRSLGCKLYMPLSADGDLQDRISGLSLQLTGNGSMVWDGNANMYKITTPANIQFLCVAKLLNGMTAADFPSNSFTSLSQFKRITAGLNSFGPGTQFAPISHVDENITGMYPTYHTTINADTYPSSLVRIAKYNGPNERKYYTEGALYDTLGATPNALPSNWTLEENGYMFGFVRQANGAYSLKQYYIKEVYVFDGDLSLDNIRIIQGFQ